MSVQLQEVSQVAVIVARLLTVLVIIQMVHCLAAQSATITHIGLALKYVLSVYTGAYGKPRQTCRFSYQSAE